MRKMRQTAGAPGTASRALGGLRHQNGTGENTRKASSKVRGGSARSIFALRRDAM